MEPTLATATAIRRPIAVAFDGDGPVATEIKGLEAILQEKSQERDAMIDAVKGEGSEDRPFEMDQKTIDAFQASLAESKAIEGQISVLKGHDSSADFLKALREPETPVTPVAVGAAIAEALKGASPEEVKTLGQMFTESDEFKAMVSGGKLTMDSPFSVKGDLGGFYGRKDVFSAMPTGTPGSFGTIQRDPMIQRPQRSMRVRSLFPARPTSAALIEFFQVTGFVNAASPVPERDGDDFAAKPQSSLTFEGRQAPVRTIAHWEAAHRTVLRNEPVLQSTIENELLYGLRLAEDDQILNGTGEGEDLLGILNTPGVQEYAWSDGPTDAVVADNKADAIRRAMTKVLLAYYEPTGVVVDDRDWEDIELTKNSQGDYLLAVSIALGGEPRVWRAPVVATPAMGEGNALVGAFGLGAQLYDAEEGNIRIAEQHSDFFVRNAIVILAEQALALATKRPESFVKIDFDSAPVIA